MLASAITIAPASLGLKAVGDGTSLAASLSQHEHFIRKLAQLIMNSRNEARIVCCCLDRFVVRVVASIDALRQVRAFLNFASLGGGTPQNCSLARAQYARANLFQI